MRIIGLSGSIVGKNTSTAMKQVAKAFVEYYPEIDFELIDLADLSIDFADGRHFQDYDGDTGHLIEQIMLADALIIGTPIFQASIPAPLKNVFDLLPEEALQDKVVSLLITAGSSKHFFVAETQIKPILSYLKATILQKYLFITGQNFFNGELVADDLYFRIQNLIEDTVLMTEAQQSLIEARDAKYDF